MKNREIGYVLTIIFFILYSAIARVFGIKPGNNVLTGICSFVFLLISFIQAIFNIRNGKNKGAHIVVLVIVGVMLIAILSVFVGFVIGDPEFDMPLY